MYTYDDLVGIGVYLSLFLACYMLDRIYNTLLYSSRIKEYGNKGDPFVYITDRSFIPLRGYAVAGKTVVVNVNLREGKVVERYRGKLQTRVFDVFVSTATTFALATGLGSIALHFFEIVPLLEAIITVLACFLISLGLIWAQHIMLLTWLSQNNVIGRDVWVELHERFQRKRLNGRYPFS